MVTIIIANENTRQALNLCLLSIRKYTRGPYRVIVADNASTDGSLELLKKFPWVKTLKVSGMKLGERHGKALDLAAKKVKTKYFLTLDSDVEILDHSWLDNMVDKISETDAAFVGEVSPKFKSTYWGNFKERAQPYCLLVNTRFFKKNNCTFVPRYNWKQKGYQSDVGSDILFKAKKAKRPYSLIGADIKNRLFHYGSLTVANLFEDEEWMKEFEDHLNNRLNLTQQKDFRNYISQMIKTSQKKLDLVEQRIQLIQTGAREKAVDYPGKNSKNIKHTLGNLSWQLLWIAENHLKAGNFKASILKLKEAQIYASTELKCKIMATLASAYLENKMPAKAEPILKILEVLKPQSLEVLYSIGYAFKKNNDFKNAAKFFNKVARTQISGQKEICNRAFYHLGEISLETGETLKAKNYFGQCLKFNPNHQKASHYMAKISTQPL